MNLVRWSGERPYIDHTNAVVQDIAIALADLMKKSLVAEQNPWPSVILSVKPYLKDIRTAIDRYEKRLEYERDQATPKPRTKRLWTL